MQTASKEKEQQLLAELDTIRSMCRDKDQQILRLKEELRAKQEEMTSLSDEFEQREKEIQEQKGTHTKLECS